MLKDYVCSDYVTHVYYQVVFDDGLGNGYGFDCDENGNLIIDNPTAINNYKSCLEHPEKFVRFNKVIKHQRRCRTNPHGTCDCGNEVELWDQYMGACQCEKCGKWYNLFGQELVEPKYWEE